MRLVITCLIALVVGLGQSSAALADFVIEPETYRMSEYRAPVPDTVPGGETVSDEAARALWQSGTVGFIDVLPGVEKPKNFPEGAVWQGPVSASLPGAIWLPNTGYGKLDDETLAYLEKGLDQASGGNKDAPIVVFCKADCWMSWNAARRAAEMGYTRVFWYPDGVTGWEEQGWPLERIRPLPKN